MNKKTVSGMMLTLLLIGMLTLAFNIQTVKSGPKTWTVNDDGPADFPSIQEAIDSPLVVDGDIIYVHNGTYYEHLVVDKAVSLIGETRDSTVIDGSKTDIVVRVRADYVTITNFTIRNSRCSYADDSSIYIYGYSHNTVKGNMFAENFVSIYLNNAHSNIICNNEVTAAFQWYTIWLRRSNHNVVEKNLITNNRGSGISLWASNWNTINGNNVTGIRTLPTANGVGIVLYAGSHSNVVSNNWLAYNRYSGLSLMQSEGNIIQKNIMESNDLGIYSWQSSNNTIHRNTVSNNDWSGIYLYQSNENSIYHNNFLHNRIIIHSAYDNTWDDGYPSGGNYWSDYNGSDFYGGPHQNETGYDWIGDSPYVIGEDNQDNYPLMDLFVPEKDEIRIAYRNLLLKHSELLSDFATLNLTCQELLGNLTDLQAEYDSLLATINDMQEQIDSLNSTLISGQEAVLNELVNTRTLLYVFITATTSLILTATIVYFALRKRKIKP